MVESSRFYAGRLQHPGRGEVAEITAGKEVDMKMKAIVTWLLFAAATVTIGDASGLGLWY